MNVSSAVAVAAALLAVAVSLAPVGCSSSVGKVCTQSSEGFADLQTVTVTDLPGATREDPTTCKPRLEVVRSLAQLRAAYVDAGILKPDPRPNAPLDGVDLPPIDFSRQSVFVIEGGHDVAVRFVAAQDKNVTIGTQTCSAATIDQCDLKFRLANVVIDVVKEHVCADLNCSAITPDQSGE